MTKKSFASRLLGVFTSGKGDEEFYEELEEALVEGDFGALAAMDAVDELRTRGRDGRIRDREALTGVLSEILSTSVKAGRLELDGDRLNIVLVLGVNGVGKTTTIAKLARYAAGRGIEGIVLCAADTFRAGAIEQLEIQGERVGARVIRQESGSDPGAVVYDALASASSRGDRLILVDTAGRMHNKANLVKELQKIDKVIRSRAPDALYSRLLVIDSNTGQNALRQAESFNEALGIDLIAMAKYDSSAKGGVAVAISKQLGIPFGFLGTGEGLDDLEEFDGDRYVRNLVGAR